MAREKFTIRLSEKEKRKFTEYYQEHTEQKSLSEWLRTIAQNTVKPPTDDDTSALDEALLRSIIQDETREIQKELADLTKEVAELDDAIRTGDDITALAEEAYLLFSGQAPEHIDDYPRDSVDDIPDDMSPEWFVRNSGLPEALAAYFGIETEVARRVLVRCENMFPAIESELNNAGYRYWFHADATTRDGVENVGDGV
jgi:hypothetical protein